MTKIITTDNGQQYQTAGFGKTAGAVIAGSAVSGALSKVSQAINKPCIGKMQKLAKDCDTVQLQDAIYRSFGGGGTPR